MIVLQDSAALSKMQWTLTDVGAFVGTIAGIGSLVWNFAQWKKDRPSLLVKGAIRTAIGGGVADHDVLCIELINSGKRPINIKKICGINTETEIFFVPIKLPRILQEAEFVIEAYPLSNSRIMRGGRIIQLYAVDSQNKDWYVNTDDITAINIALDKLRPVEK